MRTTQQRSLARLSALALLGLCACGSDKLVDYNVLGALRVLALKADVPELDPSGPTPTAMITPVVSDLFGARTLSYSAVGCVDPGVGYGATPTCDNSPTLANLGSGAVPDPGPTKLTHTGTAPTIAVPVPTTILDNRTPIDQHNGVAYLVIYTLTATAGDGTTSQVSAFKRIIATSRAEKNANPVISDLKAAEQTLASYLAALTYPFAATPVELSPSFAAGSTQSYTLINTDGTTRAMTEQLTTTWFISDGTIEYYRTLGASANPWTPPAAQPTSPTGGANRGIVIVTVTRDGRGGEDFKIVE